PSRSGRPHHSGPRAPRRPGPTASVATLHVRSRRVRGHALAGADEQPLGWRAWPDHASESDTIDGRVLALRRIGCALLSIAAHRRDVRDLGESGDRTAQLHVHLADDAGLE